MECLLFSFFCIHLRPWQRRPFCKSYLRMAILQGSKNGSDLASAENHHLLLVKVALADLRYDRLALMQALAFRTSPDGRISLW